MISCIILPEGPHFIEHSAGIEGCMDYSRIPVQTPSDFGQLVINENHSRLNYRSDVV